MATQTKTGTGANIATGDSAWTNPTNVGADDANYAVTGSMSTIQTSQILAVSNFGFTVVGTINGITVAVKRLRGTRLIVDHTIQLGKAADTPAGDSKADAVTDWSAVEASVEYGGASDKWGLTWTASEINASTFAVYVRCQRDATAGSGTASVNVVTVTVDYTETATPAYHVNGRPARRRRVNGRPT